VPGIQELTKLKSQKTRRIAMKPKIVSRAAFTVVGMKYHGKNENNEIPQL
jgi:hypothetical protein